MTEDAQGSNDVIFPPFGWVPGGGHKKRAAPRKDFYNSLKWQTLRMEIFKRDKWTCFNCGDKGGYVNCHHIIPIAFLPDGSDLLTDPNNLVTVCRRCHNYIHEVGQFFNPWKPAGTPMRAWRWAANYFFIMLHWPEHEGFNNYPEAVRKGKKKEGAHPRQKKAKRAEKKSKKKG